MARFLLADDDDNHALLAQLSLARSSLPSAFDRVADGKQLLAYLRCEPPYADRPRPDVVLLDLRMPEIDGHEALAQIKADERLRMIPVVVLTTSDADEDRDLAYKHHANSYLVKPASFERFEQMMHDLNVYWSTWNHAALP